GLMPNPNDLISVGPPPLTVMAADCALDLIDFMAAVVRGVDLIDVTEPMREIWRNYLYNYYPMLMPPDRFWFANAPATLSQINMMWPQLAPMQREMWRQTWAMSLPATLQFLEPVLQAAHQQEVWHLSHITGPQAPAPAAQNTGGVAYAQQQVDREQAQAQSL